MSITPVSALKMRRACCEKGLPDPCAPDLRKDCDTVGALRCVKGKGSVGSEMAADGTCGEIVHLFSISVNPENIKSGSLKTQ